MRAGVTYTNIHTGKHPPGGEKSVDKSSYTIGATAIATTVTTTSASSLVAP